MAVVIAIFIAASTAGIVWAISRQRASLALDEDAPIASPACPGAWADGKAPTETLVAPIHSSSADDKSQTGRELPPGVHLRTAGNGESLINERIYDEILAGLERIPPLPQAIILILRELEDAGSTAKSIASIVSTEPVLAATILRICNSAAMGLRRQIVRMDQAVAYLGFSMIKSLVLRLKLGEIFRVRSPGVGYDQEQLWLHSLAVAQLADHLAKRVGGTDPWLASTIGLLHDIGKLATNSLFPQQVAMLWNKQGGPADESFLGRERRIFGGDHAYIGGYLAERWKLPRDLIDSVRLHHLGNDSMMSSLRPDLLRAIRVVQVANQLAKYSHVYCADMEIDIVPLEVLAELGLSPNIEDLMDEHAQRVIDQAMIMAGRDPKQPQTQAA